MWSQTNTTLTVLNLEDNAIRDDGVVHIADMLSENCYITHLASILSLVVSVSG